MKSEKEILKHILKPIKIYFNPFPSSAPPAPPKKVSFGLHRLNLFVKITLNV